MVSEAKNEIVLFNSKDGSLSLPVSIEADTVWLSRMQIAELFGKDRTVIGRHIRNAIKEGEIDSKTILHIPKSLRDNSFKGKMTSGNLRARCVV